MPQALRRRASLTFVTVAQPKVGSFATSGDAQLQVHFLDDHGSAGFNRRCGDRQARGVRLTSRRTLT